MTVTTSLLAPATASVGSSGLQKRAGAALANVQSLFGQALQTASANQSAPDAPAGAVIFNSSLPTTLATSGSGTGAPALGASTSSTPQSLVGSQGFIAGLKAYSAQALSAGGAETNASTRVGSPALDLSA